MQKDLRVLKTEKAIRSAFISLLDEKSFEKISVTDILKVALINRKTFYSHYTDKYDLADQMADDLYNDFLKYLDLQATNQMKMPRDFYDFLNNNRTRIRNIWKIPVSKGTVYTCLKRTLAKQYLNMADLSHFSGDLDFQGDLYASIRLEPLQYILDSDADFNENILFQNVGNVYQFLMNQIKSVVQK